MSTAGSFFFLPPPPVTVVTLSTSLFNSSLCLSFQMVRTESLIRRVCPLPLHPHSAVETSHSMIHKFGQQCLSPSPFQPKYLGFFQIIFLFSWENFFFSSQFMNFALLADLLSSSFAFIVPVSLPQRIDAVHKRIRLPNTVSVLLDHELSQGIS